MFHEFPVEQGAVILGDLARLCLTGDGHFVIGDILFEDSASRESARRRWAALWDDDEFYWTSEK